MNNISLKSELIKIVLIEDNRADAARIQALLSAISPDRFEVTHVPQLGQGLHYLRNQGFDLALLDLSLPDGRRLDAVIQIQSCAREMPIIALAGIADQVLAEQSMRIGTQDFLIKEQLNEALLDRSIRYAIDLKRLEIALETERILLTRRIVERTSALSSKNTELARSVRLRDEFLANVSHELRTPLSTILGLTEALQGQLFGPLNEKQLQSLRTIDESGRHQLSLINDILDVTKLESGQWELDVGRVVIMDVCQASLRLIQQTANARKIEVRSSFDHESDQLAADERCLKQILVNLLSNAVKFTPKGGKIGLEVSDDVEKQEVYFTVWDEGIGIPASEKNRLFEPFVQVDNDLSAEGTGLGLALVARMVKLHGGEISIESELGQGSRFTVSLPWIDLNRFGTPEDNGAELGSELSGQAASETAALSPVGQIYRSKQPIILLVEDNEGNTRMISEYLVIEGYRVIVARTGMEAINFTRRQPPDLILMDIRMPKLNGLEAIRQLRTNTALENMPIIALTALAMPGDDERCLAAGANAYLSKPISLKELAATIEVQLKQAWTRTHFDL